MHDSHDNPSDPNRCAPDVGRKANLVIWAYFLAAGMLLYVVIVGVSIFFRIEVEREHYIKVGSVPSAELAALRAQEDAILSGREGLVSGNAHVSIDTAMKRLISMAQGQ